MTQELYHIRTSGYGLQILCENIFYKDDVLSLLVSVKNSSAVSYELATPRFDVESANRTKRGLQYEKAVESARRSTTKRNCITKVQPGIGIKSNRGGVTFAT